MALGSTQPLVKMSTRNFPGGKGGRCVWLTTSPPSCAECHEIWESKSPGILWATPGQLRDCFYFYLTLLEDVCTYVILSRWILVRIRNISDKYLERIRQAFYVQQLFPEYHAFCEVMRKNIKNQTTNNNTVWRMNSANWKIKSANTKSEYTRVGTLIVATIYLQLIQNRYMFRSFTVLQCSHQHCVKPVSSDVEVVGYL